MGMDEHLILIIVYFLILSDPSVTPSGFPEGAERIKRFSRFTYRRAAFFNTLKSKIGLMMAWAAALRVNINIDGRPLPTKKR